MDLKQILGIDPVLITGITTAFIGVCGALGVKELIAKIYDRYCKKEDEKDSDHKQLQEMVIKIDEIIARLDTIERKNAEFCVNDMLIIEDRLVWMQHKAIEYGVVSRECVPRYQVLLRRYHELNDMTNVPINEEIEFNDKLIQNMIDDGNVVDSWVEVKKTVG